MHRITNSVQQQLVTGIPNLARITDPAALSTETAKLAASVGAEVQSTIESLQEKLLLAELSQGSGFTRNARPMVVYAGLVFILVVHVLLPALAFFRGRPMPTVVLPEEFWWAWAGVVSVWMAGRSYEKVNPPTAVSRAITGR